MSAILFHGEHGPVQLTIRKAAKARPRDPEVLLVRVRLDHEIPILTADPQFRDSLIHAISRDPSWWNNLAQSSLFNHVKDGGLDRAASLAVVHALIQEQFQGVES